MVALLLVELCSEAGEGLGIFGEFVGFSSGSLAESFVVVESVAGRVVSQDDGKERLGVWESSTSFHGGFESALYIRSEAL